ncbi:MAG: hypothetical protein VB144_05110 [Clostridia bacterium]|nr:hypothetical protein [Clostridia bacterium]
MSAGVTVVILASAGIVLGTLQILGSIRSWRAFVDPPTEWDRFWPQSLLKRTLGSEILLPYNYVTGIVMITVAIGLLVALARGKIE